MNDFDERFENAWIDAISPGSFAVSKKIFDRAKETARTLVQQERERVAKECLETMRVHSMLFNLWENRSLAKALKEFIREMENIFIEKGPK